MKKTIVFGSILAVFLMVMMPTLSAIEVGQVKEANKEYIEKELNNFKIMPALLRGRGVLGKLLSAIAIPIIFAILTIFGTALTATTSLVLPILTLFVKIVGFFYGNIFGITTNAFRALLVVAILLLF